MIVVCYINNNFTGLMNANECHVIIDNKMIAEWVFTSIRSHFN